jgi:hypothetical protein
MMQLIHERRFHALPGVEEFVRGLWRTTPLAICSGALREEIEAMLEGVALRDCFSVIVAGRGRDRRQARPAGLPLDAQADVRKDRAQRGTPERPGGAAQAVGRAGDRGRAEGNPVGQGGRFSRRWAWRRATRW